MTVTSTSSKVVCLGNGITTSFAFNFLIPASGQEQITLTDASGNSTPLVSSQYSVSGFNNPAGGTVTYPKIGPAIPTGSTLTIARVLSPVQSTSISNQGAFYPQAVENALDYVTMVVQQALQSVAQSLKGPIVDSVALGTLPAAAQRANQLLGFDSTGQPIASQPSSAAVSSVMQPVVNASSIAQAVGLLGLPIFIGTGTSTGTANAQVVGATTPGTFILTAGFRVIFIPGFTNTGAMTLQVGATTAKNLYVPSANGPVPMAGGEVVAGQIAAADFDGTQFVLSTPNPTAVFGALTNLASAGTTDLGTIHSHNINITGTNAISSFGTSASTAYPIYQITFAGALTLTYNATSMILPGAGNIYTAAGDTASALYLGSGNWQIIDYQQAGLNPNGSRPTGGTFKALKVQVASDTTVTVTADGLVLDGTSGNAWRVSSVNLTNTITTSGANGLDTGSATASNWYSVWIIFNQTTNTVASLVSLSATAPTMPSGYAFKMRVGWVRYDSQPKLWRTIQYGRVAQIVIGTNPLVTPVVANGGNGTVNNGSPTLASISLAAFVPPTACKASLYLYAGYKNGGIGTIIVAPNTSFGGTSNGPNGSNGQVYPLIINNTGGYDSQGFAIGQKYDLVLEALSFGMASGGAAVAGLGGWEDNL